MTVTVTRVMVRNSERSDFTQCRWKWWQAYVERIRPVTDKMDALLFGDICHRALAGWYIPEKSKVKAVRGIHPAITAEKIFDALEMTERDREIPVFDVDSKEWYDSKELAIGMMEGYIKKYGKDDGIQVVYPEMPFQLDIYNEDGLYVCTLVGTTDALIRSRSSGKLGLFEHKTAAQISTDHLALDEQANTYWTVLPIWLRENGILRMDQDLEFMQYNFLRKTMIKDDRPQNAEGYYLNQPTVAKLQEALNWKSIPYPKGAKKEDLIAICEKRKIKWQQLGEISATQPEDLFHREMVYRNQAQREKTMHRILAQVREMKLVKAGNLEVYKTPAKHCAWCQYKDLCEIDEYGSDTEDYLVSAFYHWNPYRDHIWSLDIAA
jgi:hypothetical protein